MHGQKNVKKKKLERSISGLRDSSRQCYARDLSDKLVKIKEQDEKLLALSQIPFCGHSTAVSIGIVPTDDDKNILLSYGNL